MTKLQTYRVSFIEQLRHVMHVEAENEWHALSMVKHHYTLNGTSHTCLPENPRVTEWTVEEKPDIVRLLDEELPAEGEARL